MKVKIKAAYFEGNGVQGKKGDTVEIPDKSSEHSACTKHALKTGNLVVMDLRPVTSSEVPAEDSGEEPAEESPAEEEPADPDSIADMKYNDLKKLAKEFGIKSYKVKKPELVELIKAAQSS